MSYYRIFVGTLGQQGRLIEWNYKPKQGQEKYLLKDLLSIAFVYPRLIPMKPCHE